MMRNDWGDECGFWEWFRCVLKTPVRTLLEGRYGSKRRRFFMWLDRYREGSLDAQEEIICQLFKRPYVSGRHNNHSVERLDLPYSLFRRGKLWGVK